MLTAARRVCFTRAALMAAPDLLTNLLRDVSRSFYLTMRVLPAPVRRQIGLAYLLARATDTIADTKIVSMELRLQALRELRERILSPGKSGALNFGTITSQQGLPAERVLLERIEEALAVLQTFSTADQKLIRDVLAIITSGQELDLQRFAGASESNIVSLRDEGELDDYTYRVAGCVGEFWTRICRAHLFPKAPLDEVTLMKNAVRFGKGLQLVNILRDLPKDLREGRCYLPAEKLREVGLVPADLLNPENISKLRPLYDKHLTAAQAFLAAGWDYTNALPYGQMRVRLACAWPILIGAKTLSRLRTGNVLDATQRIKISRADVRRVISRSVLTYPWPPAWRRLFRQSLN